MHAHEAWRTSTTSTSTWTRHGHIHTWHAPCAPFALQGGDSYLFHVWLRRGSNTHFQHCHCVAARYQYTVYIAFRSSGPDARRELADAPTTHELEAEPPRTVTDPTRIPRRRDTHTAGASDPDLTSGSCRVCALSRRAGLHTIEDADASRRRVKQAPSGGGRTAGAEARRARGLEVPLAPRTTTADHEAQACSQGTASTESGTASSSTERGG